MQNEMHFDFFLILHSAFYILRSLGLENIA